MAEKLEQALRDILNILGPPCDIVKEACQGCSIEIEEARWIAQDALGMNPPPIWGDSDG